MVAPASATGTGDILLAVLESDLRLLSAETRRTEGFTGWLTGPEHLAVKESAERAVLKLRSLAGQPDCLVSVSASKDILRPFLMGLESKSPKLASISLVSIQKLCGHGALSDEGISSVAAALEQVERLHDDSVQLKVLQTALILMQSLQVARLEDSVRGILGVCFRLLGAARNSDSVVSTAAATVRQVVALVFEHISLPISEQHTDSSASSPMASGAVGDVAHLDAANGADRAETHAPALLLLDDLCAMATGGQHTWLRSPVLSKPFVLELLDFVLNASADAFRTLPAFENALISKVCSAALGHMRLLLDPACEAALQNSELKVMLRVVRTVLRQFHTQLKAKCGAFVEALLAGTIPSCTIWQRISVMHVVRQLCEDAHMVHFLFVAYDQRWEVQLDAVQAMLNCCVTTIEINCKGNPDFPDEDPVAAVGALYQKQPQGKDWPPDSEHGQIPVDTGTAYLTLLALEAVLGVAAAINELTSAAVAAAEADCADPDSNVDRQTCTALATKCFEAISEALGFLLARSTSDAMTSHLLEGIQSFTEACARLDLGQQRDSLLRNLNHLCITLDESDVLSDDGSTASGALAILDCSSQNGKAILFRLARRVVRMPSAPRMWLAGTEGVQLSHKNVAALRTLFAVASSLEQLLGDGWHIVLGTINCLDCILATPRTISPPQEGAHHAVGGPTSSDLATLSAAAAHVFESTVRMSGESVVGLLAALHDVSAASLSSAAMQPGTVKLFALGRMVDVLHFNMERIYDLWGIFLAHVLEVLASPKVALRAAAMDAVGKAINGALARPDPVPASAHGSGEHTEDAQSAACDADAAAGVEHMLLVALTALYTPDREVDVRLGVLRVAITVLQRHGERLTTGWVPLLRLLAAVPERGEAEAISLAFQSVQLMCSDFMSSLPPDQLRKCLEVAALYAGQQEDLNVTLTAISQLWNAADFLAHARPGRLQSKDGQHSEAGSIQLDTIKYEELLELLLNALQSLSTDTRPEVRNSGVRTLYSVVVSHGAKLSDAQWRQCFWGILFPLLRTVHHMSVNSSREEAAAEVLGKLGGESVTMLVHHSRNSAQKQWDETLVLALQGMGRLLRAHLPLAAALDGFPAGWQELMLVVESSMAGGRKDTAIAAIGLLTAVLQAHGTSDVVTRTMWKRAMRALDVGVEAAASPQCAVPLQARLELVAAVGSLQSHLRPAFDEEDLQLVFLWLEKFVRNPWSADDASSLVPGLLLPVQKAAIGVFHTIPPLPTAELWISFFETLVRLLKPHQLDQDESAGLMHKPMLTSLTMERTVDVLVSLFRDHAPGQVRTAVFAPLIEMLGRCMATRHVLPQDDLWRTAAAAFNAVVVAGLPAINIAHVSGESIGGAWEALATALEVFLLADAGHGDASSQSAAPELSPTGSATEAAPISGAPSTPESGSVEAPEGERSASTAAADSDPEQAAKDSELEVSVLDTLTDSVLSSCPYASESMRKRLVQIVDRGICRASQLSFRPGAAGSSFEHVCLRKLYVLSSRGEGNQGPDGCLLEVAQIALPILLARAQAILSKYAAEQRSATSETSGRASTANVMCVLEVAATMTLSPLVVDAVALEHSALKRLLPVLRQGLEPAHSRERAHLLVLYSSFVECVSSARDVRVRDMLQNVLTLAGGQIFGGASHQ